MNYYQGPHYDATLREWTPTRYCKAPGCSYQPNAGDKLIAAASGIIGETTPRYAVPDTDLCPVHHGRFPRILGDIIQGWSTLEQSLYRSPARETNDKVQTSGVADLGTLWNPYAAAVRADLIDYVGYLVRTIIRDHATPEPVARPIYPHDVDGTRLIGPAARQVTRATHGLTVDTEPKLALAGIYLHHSYWLSAYPSLGPDFLEQAIELRREMMKAVDVRPMKRVMTKWRCATVLEELDLGDVLCQGQLVGIVEEADSNRPTRLVCSTNPRHVVEKPVAGSWLDAL